MFERVFVVVLDSVGVGPMPDSKQYGDNEPNTLGHIAEAIGGINLPTMAKLGLGNITEIEGVEREENPIGAFGKMKEMSLCKDTTGGHWEIAGCPAEQPFPYYTQNGFPKDVIDSFVELTGCKGVLGNKSASGTAIIDELGEEHMKTGFPIVYTSADSVFQIAAHEEVIPLPKLYEMCKIAREKVCVGKHAVGRIIARPFIGEVGNFSRTSNRHDYSLQPPKDTMFDVLTKAGISTVGVGKIYDIYDGRGVQKTFPTKGNDHGVKTWIKMLREEKQNGLIMINLVDFDMLYGHRRNPALYAWALERFDGQLALLLDEMSEKDLLIITADHGCDPCHEGTDHTREMVPLLVYHHGKKGVDLGVRDTFSDIAATVLENFKMPQLGFGKSFLQNII